MNVVFILDKSGSMESVKEATIRGFNEYVTGLENDKTVTYKMSLTLFNHYVEKKYSGIPLSEVEELSDENYKPTGSTAMYDAIHSSLVESEKDLDPEEKVLCVIMTDGEENASREVNQEEVGKRIKQLEKKNWSFVFLGANQDAWIAGQKFGFSQANTVTYNSTTRGTKAVFDTVLANTAAYAASDATTNSAFFSSSDKSGIENA